jgi:hypothetical protein
MASTIWRGFITFGVISIPVRLHKAARAERVSLRKVRRQESPSTMASEAETDPEAGSASQLPGAANRQSQSGLTLVPKNVAPVAIPTPVLTPVKQASISGCGT